MENKPAKNDLGLAGIVLAGGKSTRLGQDKAGIVFSGASLLCRTVDLLRRHCSTVCVVGRNPANECAARAGRDLDNDLPWLLDLVPGCGPAGGIATALKVLQRPCLVLSCDLPLMDDATVTRLIRGRTEKPEQAVMTTFQQQETGYIEALTAIYELEALPLLETALARRLFQLNRILSEPLRHHLPYRRNEAIPFFNVNHPADLSLLRTLEFFHSARPASGAAAPGAVPPPG
ncbi:MAG TPA: molybdenum cofactor guanylyltransferase [Desulfonatronum sp.]|nr:molybdenum cofactor guanylyltransferase [Desulfonatronum sp.]